MNSPTMASSEVFESAEELAEELEYQNVLLLSLDDSVQDRESAEAEIKAEIQSLKRKLHAISQGKNNATMIGRVMRPVDDDPFASLQSSQAHNHTTAASSANSSRPSSAASATAAMSNLLSPSRHDLASRKRTHGESNGYLESENKLRRTSPTPGMTRSGSPNVFAETNGFYDLTGDDEDINAELAKVRQRQKDYEERMKRERQDEEFARSLQAEWSGVSAPSASTFSPSQPGASTGRNAYDRLLSRPVVPPQPSPYNRGAELVALMAACERQRLDGASNSTGPVIKAEPNNPVRQERMPGTFQDSDEGDSDIEIIPPSAFNDNGRHNSFQGSFSPAMYDPARDQMNGYGGQALTSTPAEQARRATMARLQMLNDAHRQQMTTMAGMSSIPGMSGGQYTLPRPSAVNNYGSPGYSGNSMNIGAPGSSVYGAAPAFGTFGGLQGPSGVGRLSNHDALSQMVQQTGSYNGMIDIHGGPLVPTMSGQRLAEIADYVHDPRRSAQEIKDLLENIRPDMEIPKEDREGTPEGLKYALYEHQKLALTWLKQMEDGTNKGGILADDMGLGKTISALALILSRPSEDRRRKTTLIVGPVALVRQWEREIQTKIMRSHRLSTFLYHSGKKATWDTLRTFDIVLTTYGTLGAEFKRKQAWEDKCDTNRNLDRDSINNKLPFLGPESKWYRVILDEAQCIKNKNTKAAQAACHLKALTRFCLTGTPMMNGVHELYSLIHFLRIKPYNEYSRFTMDFGCLSKAGGSRGYQHLEKNAMKKLQAVLKAILLRRTKTSKIDGKPILTLPEKTEEIVHAIFNKDEQAYYTALETKTRLQFNKYVKAGTVGKNYSNILVLLLRLRQAACHPHLIMDFEEAPPEATLEDMISWAKTLTPDVVRRIMEATVPFECPVCYDPVPNPRIAIPCGHDTCSECLVKIAGGSVEENIAEGNDSGDAKCPTCRGKIDMKKVIDYETFKQVHMPDKSNAMDDGDETQSEDDGESIDESSDSDDSDETQSEDDGSDEDIRKFVVPDDYESGLESDTESEADEDDDDLDTAVKKRKESTSPKPLSSGVKKEERIKNEMEDEDNDDDLMDIKDFKPAKRASPNGQSSKLAKKVKKVKRSKRSKRSNRSKGKGKSKAEPKEKKPKHTSLAMLKKEASRSAEGRRRYMRYLRKNWVSSAKVDKCLEILRNTEPDIKTIIFSQFTTLLDLVEVPIKQEKWGFMRYDGSMSADARHHAVVNFTDDPHCKVMLVSLKAGNAGLNLVAASQVIILDPFWNPYVEMQAVDRAHRIGQQKPVKVHRILVEKTVEDRIIELQNKKRQLVEAALDEKASRGLGRLGQQELIYLFNGGAERETAPRPALSLGLESGVGAGPSASQGSTGSEFGR